MLILYSLEKSTINNLESRKLLPMITGSLLVLSIFFCVIIGPTMLPFTIILGAIQTIGTIYLYSDQIKTHSNNKKFLSDLMKNIENNNLSQPNLIPFNNLLESLSSNMENANKTAINVQNMIDNNKLMEENNISYYSNNLNNLLNNKNILTEKLSKNLQIISAISDNPEDYLVYNPDINNINDITTVIYNDIVPKVNALNSTDPNNPKDPIDSNPIDIVDPQENSNPAEPDDPIILALKSQFGDDYILVAEEINNIMTNIKNLSVIDSVFIPLNELNTQLINSLNDLQNIPGATIEEKKAFIINELNSNVNSINNLKTNEASLNDQLTTINEIARENPQEFIDNFFNNFATFVDQDPLNIENINDIPQSILNNKIKMEETTNNLNDLRDQLNNITGDLELQTQINSNLTNEKMQSQEQLATKHEELALLLNDINESIDLNSSNENILNTLSTKKQQIIESTNNINNGLSALVNELNLKYNGNLTNTIDESNINTIKNYINNYLYTIGKAPNYNDLTDQEKTLFPVIIDATRYLGMHFNSTEWNNMTSINTPMNTGILNILKFFNTFRAAHYQSTSATYEFMGENTLIHKNSSGTLLSVPNFLKFSHDLVLFCFLSEIFGAIDRRNSTIDTTGNYFLDFMPELLENMYGYAFNIPYKITDGNYDQLAGQLIDLDGFRWMNFSYDPKDLSLKWYGGSSSAISMSNTNSSLFSFVNQENQMIPAGFSMFPMWNGIVNSTTGNYWYYFSRLSLISGFPNVSITGNFNANVRYGIRSSSQSPGFVNVSFNLGNFYTNNTLAVAPWTSVVNPSNCGYIVDTVDTIATKNFCGIFRLMTEFIGAMNRYIRRANSWKVIWDNGNYTINSTTDEYIFSPYKVEYSALYKAYFVPIGQILMHFDGTTT